MFLVCTHSVAGALPLGILIVSDERTTTLVEGFTLLKNRMGEDWVLAKASVQSGFYSNILGRGNAMISIVMYFASK